MIVKNNIDSGMGKDSVVPDEIKGWSWGAFFLNWIWGIGNSTYIALLMFVPLVNIILLFVLGAKGNEWAWQNQIWRDVDHFKSTQRKWTIASLILFFIVLPLLFVSIMSLLKGEAYEMSVKETSSHPEVLAIIGNDPKPGYFVLGKISHSGSESEAQLNYSLKGTTGKVQVYVYADKPNSNWNLVEVHAIDDATNKNIVVKGNSE